MTEDDLSSLRVHFQVLTEVREEIRTRNLHTRGYIESGPVEIAKEELANLSQIAPDICPPFDYLGNRISDGYNSTSFLAYLGGVLARLSPIIEKAQISSIPRRNFNYILKNEYREIIERDFEEAQKALRSGCWKATIILAGSCLEGILTDLLLQRSEKAKASRKAPKDEQTGIVKEITEWGLSRLILVSTDLSLIDQGVDKRSHSIREYRDLVHPSVEIRSRLKVSEQEAKISMLILDMVHNHLEVG